MLKTEEPRIERVEPHDAASVLPALADILLDCVDGGASVSFMAPLSRDKALQFWRGVLDGVARGERIVLMARDAQGHLSGTVQVILAQPENQPHRADVAKMLVHRRARRQGLGEALMRAAERAALQARKTLLVLDTASDAAERLYARAGWIECGRIPGYALLPGGEPCATTYFYKQIVG
ncbi:MAG TPA: GNAT family N-acetyltransferase [Burkholderiaceae bacterium]